MAFSQLKIFFVGKNRGRKWQQRKPESQHPQRDLDGEYITGIYGFQFQHHTCGRKTPRRRFQASKLCILRFERWKNIQNFTKKKNKPKIQGDKNRFRNGWIWGNSTQVSRVETQWHPWRLTSEGWNFPHHLHQRSAPFGLCRKPGHHVCVFVKPSLHRVLPHLQVMPGWGWTCPSQGGDLLGL